MNRLQSLRHLAFLEANMSAKPQPANRDPYMAHLPTGWNDPPSDLQSFDLPPMIERSLAAFRRDLPELMKTHYRKWVAYHGDERIGFGKSQTELYQQCFRRGLTEEEFVVRNIEPQEPEEVDPEELMDI
jgi:hypothetical protein